MATEARAVSTVLRQAPAVFAEVEYQPSSIVLHNDVSLMPPRRSDWQTLNVAQEPGHPSAMSQLTVRLERRAGR